MTGIADIRAIPPYLPISPFSCVPAISNVCHPEIVTGKGQKTEGKRGRREVKEGKIGDEYQAIDYLLEYGGFLLDPKTPQGVMHLYRYTFKTSGGNRKPKLIYRQPDGDWYRLVSNEIRPLWNNATPWSCPTE